MTLHKLERNRHLFIEKFKTVAKSINYHFFDNAYQIEVFFSGRDEDSIVISFKSNIQLIELSIGLINHHYDLIGSECIYYKFFKIENGQFNQVLEGTFAISENHKKLFDPELDLILERYKHAIQELFGLC